jgi:uncharacterized protein (UPF0276 family)
MKRPPTDLGVGVGLRVPHYRHVLETRPRVDFFEVISENFMCAGGKPIYHLEQVLEAYRVVQHGVSLGIGGPEPPSREYLAKLKQLVKFIDPPWVSDHFCWCGAENVSLHDLLPLPYTEEVVRLVAERARMVQDFLEVPFALENTSSYLAYTSSTMPEQAFISEIAERADIGLLFDVNNAYVSAVNHGLDPYEMVENVAHERIFQIHLAGHTNLGRYIIDTHDGPVIDPVWDLYRATIERTGAVSTLIEWDDRIPAFDVLMAEAERARAVREEALASRAAGRIGTNKHAIPGRTPGDVTRHQPWTQGGPRERPSS